jgi:hypothetical protein
MIELLQPKSKPEEISFWCYPDADGLRPCFTPEEATTRYMNKHLLEPLPEVVEITGLGPVPEPGEDMVVVELLQVDALAWMIQRMPEYLDV